MQQKRLQTLLSLVPVLLVVYSYFLYLGKNSIWNPNEGFYADAVRHMLQSGNVLDFIFNDQYRFNKPPVTYWSVALSCLVFGVNEFSIRLPMVLMALGTSVLTGYMGKIFYGKTAGYWSGLAMAVSFQFLINTRYATPEIPLTFFFTLTMLFFVLFWFRKKKTWLCLGWISLGFTMLSKGYPYLVIIGAILVSYLFIQAEFRWKNLKQHLRQMHFLPGILLSLIIGMSWPAYSYLKFGKEFLEVLDSETLYRAFRYQNNWIQEIFFFPSVILWGFLPYSLVVIFSGIAATLQRSCRKELLFPLVWTAVILVIFTLARFKLPTYFIQAHPAMALIAGWYIAQPRFKESTENWFNSVGFFLPAVVFCIIILLLFILLHARAFALTAGGILLCLLLFLLNRRNYLPGRYLSAAFPLISMLLLFTIFTGEILPSMEKVRPYKEIGSIVLQRVPEQSAPIFLENRFLYNLPFYSRQKTVKIGSGALDNFTYPRPYFILAESSRNYAFDHAELLWEGLIYRRDTEAAFFPFLESYYRHLHGDPSGFIRYRLWFFSGNKKPSRQIRHNKPGLSNRNCISCRPAGDTYPPSGLSGVPAHKLIRYLLALYASHA